jgi:rhamnosyltransferase
MNNKISVGLPLYQGFDYLNRLSISLKSQIGVSIELVVIETDPDGRSESYLRSSFHNLIYDKVEKKDFSHSQTRQRILEMASCETIIFITQDAVPSSNLWALQHVEALSQLPESCAALVGKQIPEVWAPVHQRRRIESTFQTLGGDHGITLFFPKVAGSTLGTDITFLSDSNCSYRRSILASHVPFPIVDYAEDQAVARDLKGSNYLLAYSPFASVIHTNKLTLLTTFTATKAEIVGLALAFNLKGGARKFGTGLKYFMRNFLLDVRWIFLRKENLKYLKGLPLCFLYEFIIALAHYSADHHLRRSGH